MRTRLILAAVCILTLPLWFSASPGDKSADSSSFAIVVYAGHTVTGGWCECGAPGCLCDPGEIGGQSARPVSDQTRRRLDQSSSPIHARSGSDLGAGALMLAFALFLWTRFRA